MSIPSEIVGTFWKGVSDILNALFMLIMVGAIPFAAVWLKAWFAAKTAEANAKIEALKNKDKREAIESALVRLDRTAATVVAELDQSKVVRDAESGKITDPDKIKAEAVRKVVNRLPTDAVTEIKLAYSPDALARLVSSKIEEKVLDLKLQKAG